MLNYIDFEIPVKITFLCIVLYIFHCFIQFIEYKRSINSKKPDSKTYEVIIQG